MRVSTETAAHTFGKATQVPSVAPISPVSPYLALPAPGGSRVGASGAIDPATTPPPIQPVPPVSRRTGAADDGQDRRGQGNGGVTGDASSRSGASRLDQDAVATATEQGPAPPAAATARPATTTAPSTGFVVQRLSQEALGTGLHIEPWDTALSSYRAAAALPASTASSASSRNASVVV